MGFLIEAVAIYSAYIYAACGLVALYHIYRVWQVRSERRQAVFSLEREKAVRELYGIFYVAMLLVLIMGLTYFVSNTLAQAVEPIVAEARNPQPALPVIPTPTNTPLPVTPTTPATLPTPTTAITQTVATPAAEQATTPQPSPTPVPPPVVAAPAVCPDGRAAITSPGNGQLVSGVIAVTGTASHESFQYYKVEFAPGAGAESGFVYLGGGNSPVQNGVLATVDTGALGPGVWTLRLVVVDQTGNFPAPCFVTITVGG